MRPVGDHAQRLLPGRNGQLAHHRNVRSELRRRPGRQGGGDLPEAIEPARTRVSPPRDAFAEWAWKWDAASLVPLRSRSRPHAQRPAASDAEDGGEWFYEITDGYTPDDCLGRSAAEGRKHLAKKRRADGVRGRDVIRDKLRQQGSDELPLDLTEIEDSCRAVQAEPPSTINARLREST